MLKKGNIFYLSFVLLAIIQLSFASSNIQASSTGESLYLQYCAACHQPNGKGIPGFFPPLAANPLVVSEDPGKIQEYLGRVIFGYHGGLMVDGQLYSGTMPPVGYLECYHDSELLALINYQRTAWGNAAKPVTLSDLAKARGAKMKEDWKPVTSTTDMCSIQYDANNISYLTNNRLNVWVRTSRSPACKAREGITDSIKLGKDYGDYEYNSDFYEVNCSENSYKLLKTLQLTKDGKVLYSIDRKEDASVIPRGSIIEAVKEIICKKK
jgi:mono/diheme cytochrome c family protein